MKTFTPDYGAHVASGATTLAVALRIRRADGAVYGFTSHDRDATINGVTYSASPGMVVTGIEQSSGLNVDNLELTTLDDGSVFQRADIMAGVWRNAGFDLLRYNWLSPADGTEPITTGIVGEATLRGNEIVVELRGLQQYLQQPLGNVTSKTCRARFADYPTANGSNLCRLDVAARFAPGKVTAVTSRTQFTGQCTSGAAVRAEDEYGDGVLEWLTGANTGRRAKVVTSSAAGLFTLGIGAMDAIAVGDTYRALPGCRKRLDDDCVAKHANALNFCGEPHAPGIDALTASPVLDV